MMDSTQSTGLQEKDEEMLIGDPVNKVAIMLYCTLGLVILLSGILGNGFLIVMLASQGMLRDVHNIFIANLALADLVVVCTGLPFLLLDLLLGYHPVVNKLHCMVNGFILCLAYSLSILSLVTISFNRYMKVCHHHLALKIFTFKRSVLMCLGLWTLGLLLQVPLLIRHPGYGYDTSSHCCQARHAGKELGIRGVAMVTMLFLSMLLIGFFNFAMFRAWKASRSRVEREGIREVDHECQSVFYVNLGDSVSSSLPTDIYPVFDPLDNHHRCSITKEEMTLVRSLLVISVCLFLFYAPFVVCLLTDYGTDVPSEVMVFVSLLLFVNCSVNWIIYGAMNTSFRQGYVRTLRYLKCRCSRS